MEQVQGLLGSDTPGPIPRASLCYLSTFPALVQHAEVWDFHLGPRCSSCLALTFPFPVHFAFESFLLSPLLYSLSLLLSICSRLSGSEGDLLGWARAGVGVQRDRGSGEEAATVQA